MSLSLSAALARSSHLSSHAFSSANTGKSGAPSKVVSSTSVLLLLLQCNYGNYCLVSCVI